MPARTVDIGRSVPPHRLAPLARPDVRLIALQKDSRPEDLSGLEILDGPADGPDGFADSAVVIMSLDLVITSGHRHRPSRGGAGAADMAEAAACAGMVLATATPGQPLVSFHATVSSAPPADRDAVVAQMAQELNR